MVCLAREYVKKNQVFLVSMVAARLSILFLILPNTLAAQASAKQRLPNHDGSALGGSQKMQQFPNNSQFEPQR